MRHAQHGEAIVLVGDFNANAASATIRHLQQRLFRTYAGNFLGGIDNVFSNIEASAVVQRANLGKGGSDHDALSVTFELGLSKAANQNVPSSSLGLPQSAGSASITMLPQASQGRPVQSTTPALPLSTVPGVPPAQPPLPPWRPPGSKLSGQKLPAGSRANAIFLPPGALARGQPDPMNLWSPAPQRPQLPRPFLQPPQPGRPASPPALAGTPSVRLPLPPMTPPPAAGDIAKTLQPPGVGALPLSRLLPPRENHPMYYQ